MTSTHGETSSQSVGVAPPPRVRRPHRRRDVRRFQRQVAAGVLLVPATAVTIGRLFVTDDSDTRRALDLIATDPTRATVFAVLGYLSMLTLVPAILAMARLARRRRPVLTTVALGVNLVAYLGGWAMAATDSLYLNGAKVPIEQRDGAATLIDLMWSSGLAGISTLTFVIGHVIGAILMGLALRGTIHPIGWVAMIASQPGHVIAFTVFSGILIADFLAWSLMALAFAMCAVRVLRTADDDWDLPPLPVEPGPAVTVS